ncbi:MAG: glutathione binding-like protein [Pseudomonadales bacterium]
MSNNDQTSPSPEFIPLEEAAAMTSGTRVTFIPGIPALYSEALKNICYAKGIPLIRALHPMMGIDEATGKDRQAPLYELTRQTSLPTMFHNDERPRNVWIEQLALADQIGAPDSPQLIPSDFEQRVEVFGLCAVVLAEDGFIWNMRLLGDSPLARKYGYGEEASAQAPGKMAEALGVIERRLAAQEARDSRYLVGDSVSAADIYWATMSIALVPPPPEIMPVTQENKGMLKYFARNAQIPAIAEVLTERIAAHQRYILTTYCETPAVLGGTPIE